MLRLDSAKPLESELFEVWKFSAKLRTTPAGVIRTIRPPRPSPAGVTVIVAAAPEGDVVGLTTVMNSGPCTGTRMKAAGVVFGTETGTDRPEARSATNTLPALAGGKVMLVTVLLM